MASCFKSEDDVAIVVMDSILTPDSIRGDNEAKDCLETPGDIKTENVNLGKGKEEIVVDATSLPDRYDEWKKKVEEVSQCMARKLEFEKKPKIIIVPAVGRLGNVSLNGNIIPVNYGKLKLQIPSVLLYREVFQLLKNYMEKEVNLKDHRKKEIKLDITHGVNYLPLITFKAVEDLAPLLGYSAKVYYAIPSAPNPGASGGNPNSPQGVFEIKEVITTNSRYFDVHGLTKVKGENKTLVEALKSNGILLAWYLCRERREKGMQQREEQPSTFQFQRKMVDISRVKGGQWLSGQIINLDPVLSYPPNLDTVLAEAVSNSVCEKLGTIGGKGVEGKVANTTSTTAQPAGPSVEELQRIVRGITVFSEIGKDIISQELDNIFIRVKKRRENLCKDQGCQDSAPQGVGEGISLAELFSDIYGGRGEGEEYSGQVRDQSQKDQSQFRRNFAAHGGLLKEITMVNIRTSSLRYSRGYEEVLDLLGI